LKLWANGSIPTVGQQKFLDRGQGAWTRRAACASQRNHYLTAPTLEVEAPAVYLDSGIVMHVGQVEQTERDDRKQPRHGGSPTLAQRPRDHEHAWTEHLRERGARDK